LTDLLKHPKFIHGDFSTALIAEHFSEIRRPRASAEQLALAAALFYQHSAQAHAPALSGWRNGADVPWSYQLAVDDAVQDITVSVLADHHLQANGIDIRHLSSDGRWATAVINGIRRRSAYHLDGAQLWLPGVSVTNRNHHVANRQPPAGGGRVEAPMDGAIVDVRVRAGERVTQGQLLLVLEAMKMEHPLKAGIDGVVKAVQVMAGDQVRNRQVLLEIE